MKAYREIVPGKEAGLTPVQQGIKRALSSFYSTSELESSSRIDALMKRLEQKDRP